MKHKWHVVWTGMPVTHSINLSGASWNLYWNTSGMYFQQYMRFIENPTKTQRVWLILAHVYCEGHQPICKGVGGRREGRGGRGHAERVREREIRDRQTDRKTDTETNSRRDGRRNEGRKVNKQIGKQVDKTEKKTAQKKPTIINSVETDGGGGGECRGRGGKEWNTTTIRALLVLKTV